MPLGNLTSQFFANIYLNELDQYVKHKLKAKYYIRYVDDFVILHQSKVQLEEYQQKINEFLKKKLAIALHPQKSQILKLEKGIQFLGLRIFYHHKLIRKKNMRKYENKMEKLKTQYKEGTIAREKIIEKFEGWLAYTSQADTYKYRKDITKKFNQEFPIKDEPEITIIKKHENLNNKIEQSKIEFTYQKTLQLLKKGQTQKQIAEQRQIKENTVWEHIAHLIEYHQIQLKKIVPKQKVKIILKNIQRTEDKLKDIKTRINDETITYNEINCVLANLKGKNKQKSAQYFTQWYKKVNCQRKCYYNKEQREECRIKIQLLAEQNHNKTFTKKEFLYFFNNKSNICILPEHEKNRFMSWKEFKTKIKK